MFGFARRAFLVTDVAIFTGAYHARRPLLCRQRTFEYRRCSTNFAASMLPSIATHALAKLTGSLIEAFYQLLSFDSISSTRLASPRLRSSQRRRDAERRVDAGSLLSSAPQAIFARLHMPRRLISLLYHCCCCRAIFSPFTGPGRRPGNIR